MRKRKLSLEDARTLVRSRITKGSAFSLSHQEYERHQTEVWEELSAMSIEDMKIRYPYATYDIK